MNDDRDLRELFRAARRADRDSAPGFESVRRATPSASPWLPGRATRLVLAGAVASVTVVAAALWLGVAQDPPAAGAPVDVARAEVPAPAEEPPPAGGADERSAAADTPAAVAHVADAAPEADAEPDAGADAGEDEEVPAEPTPAPAPTPTRAARGAEPVAPPPAPRAAETALAARVEAEPSRAEPVSGIGGIRVTVVDGTGRPLPGALVTIRHVGGFVKTTTVSADVDGVVEFPVLRVGEGYAIEVSFPGFGTRRVVDLRVRGGETTEAPVQLAEELTERVRLTAKADVIALGDSATTESFSDEFVRDLPVPGRFYRNVLTLAPGAQDSAGYGRADVHGSRERAFRMVEAEPGEPPSAESYDSIDENDFHVAADEPLSTFSIDVDTASYSNVRRFVSRGAMPPADAVRIEELINYFDYDYPEPTGAAPFSTTVEVADCPWSPDHRLARIGLRGRRVERGTTKGSNLVFLVDVSGSMQSADKLPLLKQGLGMLADQLDGRDTVAMVVYAGSTGLVLEPTSGSDTTAIRNAIAGLEAGGSTNGGAGLSLAYRLARENFIPGGVNRVILATDGDFNVGVTGESELLDIVRGDATRGVFLTVLGFGTGNLRDDRLEALANKGDGQYAYIDSLDEARKVLVEEIGGTLVTIAKDVKIQVEFNPAQVAGYRLIGYENRALAARDFNDDTKDAGEIGAGHTVTALYEIVPAGRRVPGGPTVDPLRYADGPRATPGADDPRGRELFHLKLRYKEPEGSVSKLIEVPVVDDGLSLGAASDDLRFASAVALYGMLLRDSAYAGSATLGDVERLAGDGRGADRGGHRAGFLGLVADTRRISE